MALEKYLADMERCNRCTYCKLVPFIKQSNKEYETVCPSVDRYMFHGYSQGGRLIAGAAFAKGRLGYTDKFLDMIYKCQMDGACDVSCKNQRDMEGYEAMLGIRAMCVEDGELIPAHMVVIEGLRAEDNMMMAKKADRDQWAEGLNAKNVSQEKAEVLFHAGCRYSFDESLWPIVRGAYNLLKKAGVDVGIMGADETCCAGRAYEMGYQGELTKYAEHNTEDWKRSGSKIVVTPCSDCYAAFKVLYDKIGLQPEIEILHITQYLDQLLEQGDLKLRKEVPMKVTYQDPCHLGRLGEPWIRWSGTETKLTEGLKGLIVHDPPKEFRKGAKGVYDIPRNIIKRVPGIKFVEMDRIREYAYCCGAGGGVLEAYPDFALWTADQRLKEAISTGAEAIITACGWCERNFKDAIDESGHMIKVVDIIELLEEAL